jgi:hypothetical protein
MKTKTNNFKMNIFFLLLFVSLSFSQDTDPKELLNTLKDKVFDFASPLGALGFLLSAVWFMMGSDEGKEKAKKVAIGCVIVAVSGGLVKMLMGN